jgi:predicted amidophosphoribosyltransferase
MLDLRSLAGSLAADLADLVLARTCAGCETPGSVMCAACWAHLTRSIHVRDLPEAFVAHAATDYLGIGKSVVIAHKEHGWNALTPMLGILLARAVTSITGDSVTLVPIPPHADSLARRGTDPLLDIAESAVRVLRSIGQAAEVERCLARTRDAGSLKLLGRDQRAIAVRSSFRVDEVPVRAGYRRILVDDVITTGVTASEALRTLEAGHRPALAAACVATTPLHARR